MINFQRKVKICHLLCFKILELWCASTKVPCRSSEHTLSAIYCIQMRWSAICLMRVCAAVRKERNNYKLRPRAARLT
jgi:hypothetical protein